MRLLQNSLDLMLKFEFDDVRRAAFTANLETLLESSFASRLAQRDATCWGERAAAEAAIRLGWLDFAASANQIIQEAAQLRSALGADQINEIVLCGMGGSSLGAELIAEYSNVPLTLLDSTHPDQIREIVQKDLRHAAAVFSSKSGTTAETRAHLSIYEQAFSEQGFDLQQRIIVITDPGSELEHYATAQGYRVFLADPNVGGRFSALTAFGLVPPVLAGAELNTLLTDAEDFLPKLLLDSADNPALQLAAALLADPQRVFFTIQAQNIEFNYLGYWIEQLVAESTGKANSGLLPIALISQSTDTPHATITTVLVGDTPAEHKADICVNFELGEQLVLWMVATAALGFLLHVDPFNQPDVEQAKQSARELLSQNAATATQLPEYTEPAQMLAEQLQQADAYLVVQLYAPQTLSNLNIAAQLRNRLEAQYQVPVACVFGPRYLHSTGQFHKGGAGSGVFLQILLTPRTDLAIPDGSGNTFNCFIQAQMLGDAAALRAAGKTVFSAQIKELAQLL